MGNQSGTKKNVFTGWVDVPLSSNVLISAHGNSLRSIVMFIDGLSKEQVLELEIPTGKPLFYEFKNGKLEKAGI